MTHLSTRTSILAMVFYSLLTFFIGPYVTSMAFPSGDPDKCVAGFTAGFAVSVFLWLLYNDRLLEDDMLLSASSIFSTPSTDSIRKNVRFLQESCS